MSTGLGKCSKIRHIVKLRQMLRRWRSKSRASLGRTPSDVPAGHVAVRVGRDRTRFVVPATYLNHPVFETLLVQAEEEYGFTNHGPLSLPCDESLFRELLRTVNLEELQRYCLAGIRSTVDFWPESRPLLADKSIWY